MKLIRSLKEVKLLKSIKEKQPNGIYIKSYQFIDNYNVSIANLTDEVSATIYGANIDKMLNISDALNNLFFYLLPKVDNKEDNISLYYIQIENTIYKINSVKKNNIIIERIGTENGISL